jgi:hypothetical protein
MLKQVLLLFVVTVYSLTAFSQESHLYLKGGVNIANITITDGGKYNDANSLVSFHAGLGADLPLNKYVSLQPSLLFTGKGSKTKGGQTTGTSATYFNATTNPYYIELPVNLVGKIPLAMEESNFFIGAGPYIAVGVAGKNKTDGQVYGVAFKQESAIEFSNDDPSTTNYEEGAGYNIMKRFDYGLNGTAGFQLNNILISANYGYGLSKLASGANNNNSNTDNNHKHRVLSISLGVRL